MNTKHAKRKEIYYNRKKNALKKLKYYQGCGQLIDELPYKEHDYMVNQNLDWFVKLMDKENKKHVKFFKVKKGQYAKYGVQTCPICKKEREYQKRLSARKRRIQAKNIIRKDIEEYRANEY